MRTLPWTALRAGALLLLVSGTAAGSTTFMVTNADDSGMGSLRDAIHNANTTPGADAIHFAIPGAGLHTITPLTSFEPITEAVTIDGYTQGTASANTLAVGDDASILIEIDATHIGQVFAIHGPNGGSVIQGLILSHVQNAISIGAFQNGSDGNTIRGCFIGTDASGTAASGTGSAIAINFSTGNTVGGSDAGSRNVLVTSGTKVIDLNGGSGHTVQGNYVGTDKNGTAGFPSSDGILVQQGSTGNQIGGAAAGAGNVIGAYLGGGVHLQSGGNTVQGNLIGTDATGSAALGSGSEAINGESGDANTIGGGGAGAGNLLSGSGNGILIAGGSGWTVKGNRIGTNLAGTASIGNAMCGVLVTGGTGSIGGTNAGDGNVIAFNGTQGVTLGNSAVTGWPILGNSIFANGGTGIALAADNRCDGVRTTAVANDDCDGDSGTNGLQNSPEITKAFIGSGNVTIAGKLDSTAATTFRIELFSSDVVDASKHGEGRTFLTSTNAMTDGLCHATFGPVVVALPPGERVFTATATDPGGSTSEFSIVFLNGDVNRDGAVNVADVFYLINFLFAGGPAPFSLDAADCDGSGTVDVADVFFLINFLFAGGPEPV